MGLRRWLVPRYRAESVVQLSPAVLRAWGIDALMLDLDNTLVAWGETSPSPAILEWIDDLRRAGVRLCIVSNNLSGRVQQAAAALQLPTASGRLKPSADKLRRALRILGSSPARTAMVGDQLFTDVVAGNRLGVPTILTGPLAPHEPRRIRLVRRLERRLLMWLARRGSVPEAPPV
jgi:HAD superfamily phosphatase (TIGR01668 family)